MEMDNKQRALFYTERLLNAVDKKKEAQKIYDEINTLYWVSNNNPLNKEEKLSLIRDIENLIRQKKKVVRENFKKSRRDGLESIEEGRIANASDNSELIDLIAAMKGSLK
ncbi:hypothetical protein Xsto_03942 [Xenorhabdus stockiae]|uniref:Uncharacterized protein n=1 Tax=Xenorhabdus stockiae TaxID=351614 RepID=A0A2D0KAR0_9GAMM|nr:hypothetical protein [Xenorhabdus stockiae]PHM60511.1 hypothetical protein Xsto_03942 [Xenorhabdus stockiae]